MRLTLVSLLCSVTALSVDKGKTWQLAMILHNNKNREDIHIAKWNELEVMHRDGIIGPAFAFETNKNYTWEDYKTHFTLEIVSRENCLIRYLNQALGP
jgi:hypothetical protein